MQAMNLSTTGASIEVPVLVVGAGPAGLALAIELGRQGVGCLVVERHPGTSIFPKASGISTRTMEIFRAWGIDAAVRDHSLPALPYMAIRSVMAENRGVAVPLGFPTDEQALAVSPTTPAISPQDHIEPIMLEHARGLPGVQVRFSTELVRFDQSPAGVRAVIRDSESHVETTVQARFLVGADGTRSTVRQALGIEAHGPDDLGTYTSILFRADIWGRLAHDDRYGLYQLDGPVPGVFVPAGPDDRWVLGVQAPPGAWPLEDLTAAMAADLVRTAAGMPDLEVEVLATMPLEFVAQAAERARDGNVFLIGDAAHRMPPVGGRGMNTAVADAIGLGWKLAWVVRGRAPVALLDSYEAERGPVGRHNLQLASRQGPPGSPDGLTEDLGYVYRSAAIESDDAMGESAPGHLFPTVATPGVRLPHAWLTGRRGRVSTLDLVGPGLTLFTGAQGAPWLEAISAVTGEGGIPVQGYAIGGELNSADGAFCERFGLGADGAVLVRPDGHMAWRHEAGMVTDHAAELAAAVALATGRQEAASRSPQTAVAA